MKRAIIVIASLICCITGYAQTVGEHYYFESLNIRDGLSQNTIHTILQDNKGFMWFGTKDGLNRYDGLFFKKFKYDRKDARSISDNYIISLYEDVDGNIWIGTDVGLYIYYPETEVFEPFKQLSSENTKIEHTVSMVKGDNKGHIWIAVERQGIFCYNLLTKQLKNYTLKEFPFIKSNVNTLTYDNSGAIWIGCNGSGLFYSKDNFQTLHPYISSDGQKAFENDVITKTLLGAYNSLFVSSIAGGVKAIDLTSGRVRDLLVFDERGEKIWCRDLLAFSDNELWIGCESGVYIYNLRTDKYVHLSSSAYDPYSLSDNAIYSLYKDREGGVWIGSYFGGINYYRRSYTCFEKYYSKGTESSLHGKRVREFCRDNRGNLWIGTEDGGLNCFDPLAKQFKFFNPSLGFTNVHGLCLIGDELWVGTFSKGLKVIDTRTGSIVRSYEYGNTPRSLNDNNVFAICETKAGEIYIGTGYGLMRYNKSTDTFEQLPELCGTFIYDIKEDTGGNIWLATYVSGVFRYDVSTKKWKNYLHDDKDEKSLSYNKVLSVFEDSHRNIWLTTQGGGFCLFHPETENFTRYDTSKGLPNDVVYQIVEDDDGLFWLTTNSGLVRFDPASGATKVYTTANGLLSDQFNYRSSFKGKDGTIYFGSIDGFVAFNPHTFSENKYVPSAVITDFLLFNKEMHVGDENSPLAKNIIFSEKLLLHANQNSFSFRLAALGYQAPKMNKLMYKLEGFDEEWLLVGESPLVTYSNLHYGDYVFRVKASNSDGIWNERETILKIRILPPFYLSVWAYIIYILLSIGIIVYLYLYLKSRNVKKQQRQMEKFEQEKEREIYNAKFDFFTNVAHEVRTPLTLIKGPLENIILNKHVDMDVREDLNIMKQNTERLLNLTNQLLDFRKTESQGFCLNFARCNITEVLKETYLRFTSLAKQKDLEFTLRVPEEELYASINREAFTKIISNLLSNGMKYAETYVHISLSVNQAIPDKEFYIHTENDGSTIPDAMKEEIFRPFVRYNKDKDEKLTTGTGIGLALSRSLAELHQGSLVMNKGEEVNRFCLTMPMVQEGTITFAPEKTLLIKEDLADDTPENKEVDKKGKPVVLVVEDNSEMLAFVSRQLSASYSVLKAANGAEALKILDEKDVNVIISDVMMPVMDGFELCKSIKSELNYSHIPVVLLTAKTDIQSKIEGLELGADAYIEKPFSVEYLNACVANLINNREKLRQAFAKSPFIAASSMALTKADEEFIQKLNEIIHANISNPDFSMEDMADCFNISRSNFYRKIKGVLDLSPNEYLRLERLKRAAQLLKEGEYRINEICYTVGFNSPSYFSKCFQKQFGVLPKDFPQ
ncbi:hybrid sensor histidine kinase/response regulator transcription factor [Bacteroides sp.]|uniref:hybrid sensor histidine kinase/response regulator transcription factor n=1 Tax=Bacteroides sp. TaxID=29523 RepID=UPI00262AEB46|nr:hybrid sensor histidine kinase/response regulator transcription factor [Bacteroides sp.]